MTKIFKPLITILCGAMLLHLPAQADNIVVSIKPLHSLILGVIGNTHTIHLLIAGKNSPHRTTLKPSQRRLLHDADSVFYIDKNYEFFIPAALNNNGYSISDFSTIQTYPLRTLHDHSAEYNSDHDEHDDHSAEHDSDHDEHDDHSTEHNSDHDEHDEHDDHSTEHHSDHDGHNDHSDHKSAIDPHLWLDIDNAKAIVRTIQDIFSKKYPQHAKLYKNNSDLLINRLNTLDDELAHTLQSVQKKPYAVLHDAYQYFEKHFQLQQGVAIHAGNLNPTSAKQILAIQHTIANNAITCAFIEPQLSRKTMDSVMPHSTQIYLLDPLGANLKQGDDLYFKLMQQMAQQLALCLN